jgi:hypothetical protein
MAFEWGRIHKWEENHEWTINDEVDSYVCEYYGIETTEELTREQLDEVDAFRSNELSEYSCMQIGFSNLIMRQEDVLYEREQEELAE